MVGLSELYTWGYKQEDPSRIVSAIARLRQAVRVLPFDETCAEMLGQIRGSRLRQGVSYTTNPKHRECFHTFVALASSGSSHWLAALPPYASIDLLIAATALVHDLTLVTHNTKDFARIPDLRIEDWIAD